MSDGIYEENTEINCGRYTDKSPHSGDFIFIFLSNSKKRRKKAVENLLKTYKDLSEGNISEVMLRLLETPKIQVRLLIKNKIKHSGHHNHQLYFWE